MLHTNPTIKHKAGLQNLAEEPGNVSKTCKIWASPATRFIVIKSWLKIAVLKR